MNEIFSISSHICSEIDVLEEKIREFDKKLLNTLILDRSTRKNILWLTKDYSYKGPGFNEMDEIKPENITGINSKIIQPRITKSTNTQTQRKRRKAEVFTPSWICNHQNNLIDKKWFNKKNVFNIEDGKKWKSTRKPIDFKKSKKNWQSYVDAQRLECTCGEAPYLVSRYDTVTGKQIPLHERIGLLDRKMRVVTENALTPEEWLKWSQRAFESIYGYEYQGDNLLLARENLLISYIEYYNDKFHKFPSIEQLRKIARIISWNIWQMDGKTNKVPIFKNKITPYQIDLIELSNYNKKNYNDFIKHNTTLEYIPCKIMDWRYKCSRTFESLTRDGN